MRDNTGDVPLPSKIRGEGGLEPDPLRKPKEFSGGAQGKGRAGSDPAPMGHLMQPMDSYADGTHRQGQKANPIPPSQEGR